MDGDLRRRRLRAVIGDAGFEVGRQHGDAVDHAAAPAEADGADLAGRFRMRLPGTAPPRQDGCAVSSASSVPIMSRALSLVGGRAAERRQQIDREGEEAFEREPARDVLDVRVEAAVLVHDDHGRALGFDLEARQIARDARAGGVIGPGLCHEPRVVGSDGRGARVVILQQGQQRQRRGARAGDPGQAIEELAAAEAAMRKIVIEIDDALIHGRVLP